MNVWDRPNFHEKIGILSTESRTPCPHPPTRPTLMNANQPIYYDMDMARTSYRVLHEVQTRVKDKCLVSDEKLVYMNDPKHLKIWENCLQLFQTKSQKKSKFPVIL